MPDSARRVKRPPRRPSPPAHSARRLTQRPRPAAQQPSRGRAPKPLPQSADPPLITPPPTRRTSNGQTGLDIHRPFMDDNRGHFSAFGVQTPSRSALPYSQKPLSSI